MGMMLMERADDVTIASAFEDPLDPDQAGDAEVVTTRRGLTRLALVATEAGARFQREEGGVDPMSWMLAPLRLFRGSAALDACLAREDAMRAVLLHGLTLGLDAEPATIDALLCDEPGGAGGFWDGAEPDGVGAGRAGKRLHRRQRLYSALVVIARGGELVHLFHASVAPTSSVVRERIRARFGEAAAKQADIMVGVDLECPATAGLLPPTFREMLVGRTRIRWAAMEGFDVTVEHRIPS